jgi:bifunctional non-homologous end joining protein LigD
VPVFTRNGYHWSDRFPLVQEPALRHRSMAFVIDCEAVLRGVDAKTDFDRLHSHKHNDRVQFMRRFGRWRR